MDLKQKAALALRIVEEIKKETGEGCKGSDTAQSYDELHVLNLTVGLMLGPGWQLQRNKF